MKCKKFLFFRLPHIAAMWTCLNYLISIGCKIRNYNEKLGGVLKCAVWSHSVRGHSNERAGIPENYSRTGNICSSDEHRLDLVKILVEALSPEDAFGAIFLDNGGSIRMTPFQYACFYACDEMIIYFLSFLPPGRDIPLENLDSGVDGTVFHDVFNRSISIVFDNDQRAPHERPTEEAKRLRLKTITAMMEKLPRAKELVNRPSEYEMIVPLEIFFSKLEHFGHSDATDLSVLVEIVKILGKNGASLDISERRSGRSLLKVAVRCQNPDLVEALLRMGCSMYISNDTRDISSRGNPGMAGPRASAPHSRTNGSSILTEVLGCGALRKRHPSIRILELLLAFGLDLSREKDLDAIDNLCNAIPLSKLRISVDDQPKFDMLTKLQKLRRSGELFSLKRLCRHVVRRQLKPNADELIEQMTPDMKRYLQVFNEPNILRIAE